VELYLRGKDPRWAAHPVVQKVIPDLVAFLNHDSIDRRCGGLVALGMIGPPAVSAVPAIRRCLEDESEIVRRSAVMNLAEIGTAARIAVPDIRRVIETEIHPGFRGILENALKKIEKPELIQEAPREIGQSASPR
jgi:HEAT repeat protein